MSTSTKIKKSKVPPKPQAAKPASKLGKKTKPQNTESRPTNSSSAKSTRKGGKLANIIALLRRKEGATLEQMMKATGWLAHSVRGAISGALRKKMGLTVASTKSNGIRTYRIAG